MPAQLPVTLELYSTSFCGACRRTRAVLDRVRRLLPHVAVTEHDVAFEPDLAESRGIRATPTVIVRAPGGGETMRADGVPTIDHVLVAVADAMDASRGRSHGALPASRDQNGGADRSPR
ncbi:glutaredoxin family protein [Microbacterium lushaniae]|uniref:glutaredoxin family protein n=1 Tax=Microbacterium lushaniae TaxID=2614639 RepID=UPI001EE8DDBD|nr:thioredoxin family protein [Microbacterium lushaniae]